ncbi:Hypothetical protein DEACI_0462 [Acididesulfobacillus acetoxydans]|uniref:Uncharacterized protein n=1 Tax=Acididesulfobacillus acetoxydans TaxID=1561005 RepID=A0ABM9R963_9FIRM|nr:Hypothetical protein DEACI_0462 [Acididesulfobacillus acetoxydans]
MVSIPHRQAIGDSRVKIDESRTTVSIPHRQAIGKFSRASLYRASLFQFLIGRLSAGLWPGTSGPYENSFNSS